MSIRIFTDATSDLSREYVNTHPLTVFPMGVHMSDRDFMYNGVDQFPNDIDMHTFYDSLRAQEQASTSQVNVQQCIEAFTEACQAGDDVYYIAFSSGLSGSYNSGCVAAQTVREQFPDRKILVTDTLCASLGEGLLVDIALKKAAEGVSIEELYAYVEDMKLKVHHWFTVDDLGHLKRGGRVSGVTAFVGTILNIKPVMNVDVEGHLIPKEKAQGRKRSLKGLVDHMEKLCKDPAKYPVFLSHGDSIEDANLVIKMIKQRFGVDVQHVNMIGPVVGAHSGPGTIALFFVADAPRG